MKTLKAGCVLIRPKDKTVALVYREHLNDYSFPKGHLEANESLLECAIRETAEETKREALILKEEPIYIEEYVTPGNEEVINHLYLAKDNGVSDNDSLDTHPVIWVPFNEVEEKLTYDGPKKVWNSIKEEVLSYMNK